MMSKPALAGCVFDSINKKVQLKLLSSINKNEGNG
jgi:hypothetical protein